MRECRFLTQSNMQNIYVFIYTHLGLLITYFLFMWCREHISYLCDIMYMFSVYVVSWSCFMFMWRRGHVLCLCGVVDMFYVYVALWACFMFM